MTASIAPQAAATEPQRRIPELDGLRGIAIGLVLVWHYFVLTSSVRPGTFLSYAMVLGRLTWTGVDLFFVLSGFLIGGILIDARNASNYARVFYARRFFRIVPIYAVLLILVAVLAIVIDTSPQAGFAWLFAHSLPALCYWTFTQNLFMAAGATLGANTLAITWSLAIEEQFYLTLPWIVRFLRGRWFLGAVALGIVFAPIARVAALSLWPHNWVVGFALMPCRADSLLFGVAAATIVRDRELKPRLETSRLFFPITLAALAVPVALFGWKAPALDNPIMQRWGYTCIASFYFVVLLYALLKPSSRAWGVLRLGWLRWLGGIAYGTYLLHQLILGLFFGFIWRHEPRIGSWATLVTAIGALVTTLLLARTSWNYLERPLVEMGHRMRYNFGSAAPEGPEYSPANMVTR